MRLSFPHTLLVRSGHVDRMAVRAVGQHGYPLMLPVRSYRIKTKVASTRDKRSGQTRSRAEKSQVDGGKLRRQNKNKTKNKNW